jgi:precorrin-3B synthase
VSPALDACPGVLTLHPARDGLVARIRLPGGYASAARWRALADLSRDFGDGCVDLTARGNVQLRGLRAADAEALAERTAAAGLMPSAQHDRARNITASPLAGLDGRPPLRSLVDALDAALLAGPEFAALPGRFLFALDDGTGGASLAACDIGLSYAAVVPASSCLAPAGPASGGPASGSLAPAGPASGGPLSAGAASAGAAWGRPAGDCFDLFIAGRHAGVCVPAAEAVAAVLAATRAALAAGVGDSVTRIAALADGGQSVAAAVGGALGAPSRPDTRLPLGPALRPGAGSGDSHDRDRLGADSRPISVTIMQDSYPAPTGGAGGVVVVAARLGRLTGEQVEAIAGVVKPGEVVRVGVAGRLVVPLGGASGAALARLAAAGLIVSADDPMGDVTACSGTACHRSLADVRATAGPVPNYGKTHWAGCSRRCGCPPDAEPVVALDATRYRMPGEGGA